ncbi:MAG: glutathione S-transferase family protein [Rhodobacteraceae bacterium]|nr:glutathione S-transferase family protein [Paracoccaceae bacterium]
MQLYFNGASRFVRKVLVLAHEAGVASRIKTVPVAGMPTNSDTLLDSGNPLAKIPALKLGSGKLLYDSRVICRYLDTLAEGGLYPEPPGLWEALTLEATADGIMDAAVLMVYEFRCREEQIRSGDWVEAQWLKIVRSLDHLEQNPPADAVRIDQISLACALGYLDLRHSERDWRQGRQALNRWFEAFSARQSMQATIPFLPA